MKLSRRDWLLIGVAVALVAATPAGFLLSGGSRHGTPKGCTTEIVAGFMGGETHTRCAWRPPSQAR